MRLSVLMPTLNESQGIGQVMQHLADVLPGHEVIVIDGGSVDDTVVGQGTKIDNLVHVGHNVRIGRRCLMMAGVGIAGSTHIGDDVILAGHVGVTDHLEIGHRARIAAKSAVFGDVPPGASFSGHPARPHRQFLRAQAALYRLAPLIAGVERLVGEPSDGG